MVKLAQIFLLLVYFTATAYANIVVILGVENSWPPYSDKFGEGISKDIVQRAFKAMNVDVHFVVVPYARALKMTENGKLDGSFNVTKQQSTLDKFSFHKKPILQAKASFYYPIDSPFDFQSIDQIPTGTTIALILDYEYGNKYQTQKKRFSETRVSKQRQIIQLLIKKRVEVAIMFDEVAKYSLSEMNLPHNAIKKGQINHVSDIFVAFNKAKRTQPIIKIFNQGLEKIQQTSPEVTGKAKLE